jgi:hypothetical protein
MNKKFLSAILFGALMVTATGTFVSCKDYDDDIDRIDNTLNDLKSQIKDLQTAVSNGKWITNVEQTAEGVTVTLSDNSTFKLTNGKNGAQGEAGAAGDKLTIDEATGEWLINNEKTGWFANKKDQAVVVNAPKVESDGFWYFYDAEAKEYKKSDYRANGNTWVVEDDNQYILHIPAADGTDTMIKLPKFAAISSLSLAQTTQDWTANYITSSTIKIKDQSGKVYDKETLISTLNADGSKGLKVNVIVEPTGVDVTGRPFKLVDSQNGTVFATATAEPCTDVLTRAANGLYSLHFTFADGIDGDAVEGYATSSASSGKALAIVTDGASTAFDNKVVLTEATTSTVTFKSTNYVLLGQEYNLFGKSYSEQPANLNATDLAKKEQDIITTLTGVIDTKLSIGDDYKQAYGIVINGNSFKISSEEAYGKTLTFKVSYTDNEVDGSNQKAKTADLSITVQNKATAPVGITLAATHQLSVSTANNSAAMYTYIPLANLASSLSAVDKIAWNSTATSSVVSGLSLESSKKYGDPAAKLTMGNTELTNLSFVKSDKNAASTLGEAAYLKVKVVPTSANVTVDTYKGETTFSFGTGKSAKAIVELTLTNPAAITRVPVYFSGDDAIAYGAGNTGKGLTFDIKELYNAGNQALTVVDKTYAADKKKSNWVTSGSNISIATKELYNTTHTLEVSYLYFTNATNNKFTDVIKVTGKSPIKEGTIESKIKELSLEAGAEAMFSNASFDTKDVFKKAYNLFNTKSKNDKGEDVYTANADTRIASVTVTATGDNANAVECKEITGKLGDKDLVIGWKVSAKEGAALQAGGVVELSVKIVDQWGIETVKPITLNIVK